MKTRLLQNYATTILGVLIIGFSAAMLYTEKSTPSSMSGWLAMGMMMLRSKDSLIGLAPKD